MSKEYLNNLVGNTFHSSDSDHKQYNGMKVIEIIKELSNDDYDRELIDDSDLNENGEPRYLINTMYDIRLENDIVLEVYEDEINPNYKGSWKTK